MSVTLWKGIKQKGKNNQNKKQPGPLFTKRYDVLRLDLVKYRSRVKLDRRLGRAAAMVLANFKAIGKK